MMRDDVADRSRGTTSRRTLPCGCVVVNYSHPEMPFSREAIEKRCAAHQEGRMPRKQRGPIRRR